ncbi:unnamed protein product [Polarella glacialis]|uniref:EF-hand domain-containing protein n=1 Tax=Polarella glacialis TaxID=89957 RepID=A0A813L3N9_POLGL|nr:unnamed protein product [Polarella glacialis]CAE8720851.1 unnamed protein product [Polarella glacialis]
MSSMTSSSSQGLGSTAFLAVGGAPPAATLRGSRSPPSTELRSRGTGSLLGRPQVTAHGTPAFWAALAASLPLAAPLAAGRKGRKEKRRSATRASLVSLRATDTDTDTDVDLVTQLQLEASKLRAEVVGLEGEREEQLQRDRLALFESFDLDGDGAIDDQELRLGLSGLGLEVDGLELDGPKATKIRQALDKNGDGKLQLEEFDLQAVRNLMEEWRVEERAADLAARAEERQSKELEAEKQAEQEKYASLPVRNDDVGLPTRLASVLAYLLPLMDVLRYGLFFAVLFPVLQVPFSYLDLISQVIGLFPFGLGYLALLLGMQELVKNTELPNLLRFNLRQAVILDFALLLPGLLGQVVSFVAEQAQVEVPMSAELGFAVNGVVFVLIWACVGYSTVSSLLGVTPAGIPYISEKAGAEINDTRPSDDGGSDKV